MTISEERLSVATNAAATALFGVGTGRIDCDEQQVAAAREVARRVLEHDDEYRGRQADVRAAIAWRHPSLAIRRRP